MFAAELDAVLEAYYPDIVVKASNEKVFEDPRKLYATRFCKYLFGLIQNADEKDSNNKENKSKESNEKNDKKSDANNNNNNDINNNKEESMICILMQILSIQCVFLNIFMLHFSCVEYNNITAIKTNQDLR